MEREQIARFAGAYVADGSKSGDQAPRCESLHYRRQWTAEQVSQSKMANAQKTKEQLWSERFPDTLASRRSHPHRASRRLSPA